jgi:hypothetical protein
MSLLGKSLKLVRNFTLGITTVLFAIWFYFAQPTLRSNDPLDLPIDTERLKSVVKKLSIDFHPRSFRYTENLNATADYIESHFKQAGGRVEIQEFAISGTTSRNIRCFFGSPDAPRTTIGAHYDTHNNAPGADDHASSVALLAKVLHYQQFP